MSAIRVRLLAERPDTIPVLAVWLYEQWGYFHDHDSVARRTAELKGRLQADRLPVSLVAFESDEPDAVPVGTASLTPDDLDSRPDLTPWLASVYVLAPCRGRGIGSALVEAAVEHARKLGIGKLYLFTEDRPAFYERLGWSKVCDETCRGHAVTVMSRQAGVPDCGPD